MTLEAAQVKADPCPQLVAGCDECNAGNYGGPVRAAAVIIPSESIRQLLIEAGIRDSKKVSGTDAAAKARRRNLAVLIREHCHVATAAVSQEVIDQVGILSARLEAMRLAITGLDIPPTEVIVDGNLKISRLDIPQAAVVKADESVLEVSAASLVAKSEADDYWLEKHKKHPERGWDTSSCYGMAEEKAIAQYGLVWGVHRLSFNPCKRVVYRNPILLPCFIQEAKKPREQGTILQDLGNTFVVEVSGKIRLVAKLWVYPNLESYGLATTKKSLTNINSEDKPMEITQIVPAGSVAVEIVGDAEQPLVISKEVEAELEPLAVKLNELDARIESRNNVIRDNIRLNIQDMIEAGQTLLLAKEKAGHGNFLPWREKNCKCSYTTSQEYMNVARLASDLLEKNEDLNLGNFLPTALKLLAKPSIPAGAVGEAVSRASQGETINVSTAKGIIADYTGKAEEPSKIYRYKGETVSGQISGSVAELLKDAEVYFATASLTDPTQAFVRIYGEPTSGFQVRRADLELIRWEGWQIGDRAKLVSVSQTTHQKWIGSEVEIDDLPEEAIWVSVVKQRGAQLEVQPGQLSRDIGVWRDAKGLFLISSAPPPGHQDGYVRVDTLTQQEQINLSNQRIAIVAEQIKEWKASGVAKKTIEQREAEITHEKELQAILSSEATVSPANPKKPSSGSSGGSGGGSLSRSSGSSNSGDSAMAGQKSPEEAIASCGFKIGDYIEDVGNDDKDRGEITHIEAQQIGTPKNFEFKVICHITLNSGEQIQLDTCYLKLVRFSSIAEVGLYESRAINAKEMDIYMDQVGGWSQLVEEWGKATPEERKRIHEFYPGLRTTAGHIWGEDVVAKILKADELYFGADAGTSQGTETLSNLPDSLFHCESGEQIIHFIEINMAVAAEQFIRATYSQRNGLRELAEGIDAAFVAEGFAKGLILNDRDEEIADLKAEVQRLDETNLKLEEINGDLNTKISELEIQLQDLQGF